MDKKLGVYICEGCGIKDAVDTNKLVEKATKKKAAVAKSHAFLCGSEGAAMIKADMDAEGINTVCIAACSPRVNYDVFNWGQDVIVERANIREHVAWSQPGAEAPAPAEAPAEGAAPAEGESAEAAEAAPAGPVYNKATQMMAEDYLVMGIAKAMKMLPPEPNIQPDLAKVVMVVGGGITGMKSALEVSALGYKAIIVEKSGSLGGWSAKMHKQLPTKYPFTDLETPVAHSLKSEVESDSNIKVYLNAEVTETAGAPGIYKCKIKSGSSETTEDVGTIIQATGWRPYDANNLADKYGYGNLKNVVTSMELEEMAKAGKITRPSDGKEAKNVLFVQCAGSRDPEHLPYCSSVCCMTSLKQATYVRQQSGDAKAYIIYKDMRTPGQFENYYKKAQDDPGVFLTKGEVVSVTDAGGDNLLVEMANTLVGESVAIKADLVVLATGMVPNSKPEGFESKDLQIRTLAKEYEDDAAKVTKPVAASALNLKYRQGPEVPTLQYGFADSHYICFPYESQRTGVYIAGAGRQPMPNAFALDDASGAALKAVQCVEMTMKGMAVHPRAGDMTFPEFRLESCTQCKRCTEECPFGTLDEDEKGTPKPNPNRCRRCGVCMGACPQRIVSFKNYSVDIIGSMIKAFDVPEGDKDQLRVVCLMCENDAYPALDMLGINRLKYHNNIRFVPVRCLGSVNIVWIADSLSRGVDGILLAGCKYGEDYQCHFIKGSEQCNKRMDNVQETLQKLMLERERVEQIAVTMSDYKKLPEMIDKFVQSIHDMGPNPFKGF